MKYWLPFLILTVLASCNHGQSVQISAGACEATNTQGFTITGSDEKSELCLVTGSEQEVINWRWSKDGNVFAYALHDVTVTRPALSGRWGYYRPPATNWYIANGDGHNVRHFALADNRGLSFSPDGKYAVIQLGCYYTTCQHHIYKIDDEHKICEYETNTVWFGVSDCPTLTLNNGEVWDIQKIVNDSGCVFYEERGGNMPSFCTTATPTPYPSRTLP